ncbi:MAG: helix-turn-helix domain-containing protein [Methylobacter sp.]|jgi:transcriptional regulator with XRE-family HTH domain|uniref:helix-turn-helix domain-containing protein n=1 Tax=Methylobacter sp. TaxID=2051955 RepID=UPI0025F4CE1C|nr:helix-turn-helix transcriptional regulator [Methylobacter sp.]MCK9620858.1 helix-turn-helix domain-containing protein [Methylobacter sp.]
MQIGDIVKCRRLDLSLIQKELESRSGVTQSMISKIENGSAENVSIDVLRKLARALNCSLVDLLPEADKNISNTGSFNAKE